MSDEARMVYEGAKVLLRIAIDQRRGRKRESSPPFPEYSLFKQEGKAPSTPALMGEGAPERAGAPVSPGKLPHTDNEKCPACLLHRGAAIAEVYFQDIAEEAEKLDPAAPVPHPYAGTIPLARNGLQLALKAAQEMTTDGTSEGAIAAKLPPIIEDLYRRTEHVPDVRTALELKRKFTALRRVAKKVAEMRFTPNAEAPECPACKRPKGEPQAQGSP